MGWYIMESTVWKRWKNIFMYVHAVPSSSAIYLSAKLTTYQVIKISGFNASVV